MVSVLSFLVYRNPKSPVEEKTVVLRNERLPANNYLVPNCAHHFFTTFHDLGKRVLMNLNNICVYDMTLVVCDQK